LDNDHNNNIDLINNKKNQTNKNDISFNINNPIESFSLYTNKFIKKNKIFESENSLSLQPENNEKNENIKNNQEKKEEKDENDNNKIMLIKNNDDIDKMNEYINSVLIPFVVKSFDFIKSLTMNNPE